MNNMNFQIDLDEVNKSLREKTPQEIVAWAISVAERPVVTTNFRPYEAAILHACVQELPAIKIIWCDTGYNTPDTYRHAEEIIEQLSLNVHLYVPRQTSAHRDIVLGIPDIDDPKHQIFTEQVKLEPFARAMKEHRPDVWFTNIRKGQTAFRDNIDLLSFSKDGKLKVSPFYHWTDEQLDDYLAKHDLSNEFKYYDPTKVLANRECGLHS
jgi:phosphoadenosine phosphosulfate reductase